MGKNSVAPLASKFLPPMSIKQQELLSVIVFLKEYKEKTYKSTKF